MELFAIVNEFFTESTRIFMEKIYTFDPELFFKHDFDENILIPIFLKKIPALRRILMQNLNSEMPDQILKIINKHIDDKEKSSSEFINQSNTDNNEILIYFSKINLLKFKILNSISILIIHITLFGKNENYKLSNLLSNQMKLLEKSINIQDFIKRIKSSINTLKFTNSVLSEYFNENYSDFMYLLDKDDNNDDDLLKNSSKDNNKEKEFLNHSAYFKKVDIIKFINRFIIDHCDNFVLEDIILRILDECFDISQTEEIRSKFETNEKAFLKFILTEQDKKKLKRVHSDLGESKLNDKSLKTLPSNKKKSITQEKIVIKSSSESIIDCEVQNKSFHSLSVDTQINNVIINNNSFFINNNNNSSLIKTKNDKFNFKNIKEKLIDRSFDPYKNSNNYLFNYENDANKKAFVETNRSNNIKINTLSNNIDQISSNLKKQNYYYNIESSHKFFGNNNITNNSIISSENEKNFENNFQNSNLTVVNTKTDSDLNNSFKNYNFIDSNVNCNSNISIFKKGSMSFNSFHVNSNNKSTNASNNSNNLSYKNLINNDRENKKIAKIHNQVNQVELGFNKKVSEDINAKRDNNFIISEVYNNFAKNKLSSGINAKLNYNVSNIQKLKKEKSKKKSSKNKPELINKLFEKLNEKIIRSDKNYQNINKNNSKKLNQSLLNLEPNNKLIFQNEILKDNLRQKGVDEYFEKVNQENSSHLLDREDAVFQKHQLKNLINGNFYTKRKYNKTPENLENPKFSKRKNEREKNTQELDKQPNDNITQRDSTNQDLIKLDNYSEKSYNLLRLKKTSNRSASQEPTRKLNFISILKQNDNSLNDQKLFNKSPILSHNFHDKYEISDVLESDSIKNNLFNNKEKENNISSEDEILAYSTPTKIQINRNFRKTSKDKDSVNQKGKNSSGMNLLNLFRQIKK